MLRPAFALFFRLRVTNRYQGNSYDHSQEVFHQIKSVHRVFHDVPGFDGVCNKRAHEVERNSNEQLRMQDNHRNESQFSLVA